VVEEEIGEVEGAVTLRQLLLSLATLYHEMTRTWAKTGLIVVNDLILVQGLHPILARTPIVPSKAMTNQIGSMICGEQMEQNLAEVLLEELVWNPDPKC
jgi:hypothetical protein